MHIKPYLLAMLKSNHNIMKHAQRKVFIPILNEVQDKLNKLENTEIITKVTEPTSWISSMVVVKKKRWKIDNILRFQRFKFVF